MLVVKVLQYFYLVKLTGFLFDPKYFNIRIKDKYIYDKEYHENKIKY